MARKRYTDEQVVGILKEAAAGTSVAELARKYGIHPNTIHAWKERFTGMTVPDVKRLKALEEENAKLKRKVGELTMDLDAAKELLSKNW